MNEKNLSDNSIDLFQLLKFFISKIWIAIILVILPRAYPTAAIAKTVNIR